MTHKLTTQSYCSQELRSVPLDRKKSPVILKLYDQQGREKLSIIRFPDTMKSESISQNNEHQEYLSVEKLSFLALYLMVGQAAIDGSLHAFELRLIQEKIKKWYHLEEASVNTRIDEILELQYDHGAEYLEDNLKTLAQSFSLDQRKLILISLAQIAEADNQVTPQERIFLNRSSVLLQLDLDTTQKSWSENWV